LKQARGGNSVQFRLVCAVVLNSLWCQGSNSDLSHSCYSAERGDRECVQIAARDSHCEDQHQGSHADNSFCLDWPSGMVSSYQAIRYTIRT
jgi:hypothetical protein